MDANLINKSISDWREVYERIRDSLVERAGPSGPTLSHAQALIGVRRGGKTTQAISLLKTESQDSVFYYNFEDPLFFPDGTTQDLETLLSVAEEYSKKPIQFLILDEIQNVNGWEKWLRKLIEKQKYKIIITGSSAKLLSRELATAISGRALQHIIWPLSFREFLSFHNTKNQNSTESLKSLRDYLTWGAFPEIVLSEGGRRKEILRQYLSDIVLKDVMNRNSIRNKRALDQLIVFYFTNLSNLHSYSSLKKAFNIGVDTASLYTEALKEAFLLFEVERYHKNLKIQARDPRKVYIIDNGFRKVGARSAEEDSGKLLENVVFLELKRREHDLMYFQESGEVDFLLLEDYVPSGAIQVCASDMKDVKTEKREVESLLECLHTTKLNEGIIVTWNREEKIVQKQKTIYCVPAYKWLQDA